MLFEPDYRNLVDAAMNRRPKRLPLYEHIISPAVMEKALDKKFVEFAGGSDADIEQFFRHYCNFFKDMTYDTVSFEMCITAILPDGGALKGGKAGPIQNRSDFNAYPWGELARRYWDMAKRQFEMLAKCMPAGMKAVGGVGNGVFEISEDLVGLEHLAYMQADDPQLLADVYVKIGDLMVEIWREFLQRHGKNFAVCRFGDDLGFKSGTLSSPQTLRQHVVPQYRRIVKLVRDAGLPFLWHSCGNIFEIMDDVIAVGINAKHSNEDAIAPFDRWIQRYGGRIGLFGGIDVDLLCTKKPDDIFREVVELGTRFRASAKGYALGSGNSIPDYIPADGYCAMVRAAQEIRKREIS